MRGDDDVKVERNGIVMTAFDDGTGRAFMFEDAARGVTVFKTAEELGLICMERGIDEGDPAIVDAVAEDMRGFSDWDAYPPGSPFMPEPRELTPAEAEVLEGMRERYGF